MILIGIDPGLAHLGACAIHLGACEADDALIGLDVLRTEKSAKKLGVLATEDNVRRMRSLAADLARFHAHLPTDIGPVVAVCSEAQSWPRNAGAAAKTGMAWGVVATLASLRWGVGIVQASPQAVKQAVCGVKTATKLDVEAAIVDRFGDAYLTRRPPQKTLREHAADAVAVVVACYPHPAIQAVRRMVAASSHKHQGD